MTTMYNRPACLDAALDYHARGWSALPLCGPRHGCKNPGKVPHYDGWQTARMTRAQLEDAWRRDPAGNVGVAMGPASGLCALDIDGAAGEDLLLRLSGGDLPATPEFTTHKGRRLLFRWPADADPKNKDYPLGDGEVRFLSRGRQTVMPPSVHEEGTVYAWVESLRLGEVELADCPAWLLALLAEPDAPPAAAPRPQTPPPAGDRPDKETRARKYLSVCQPAVSGANGHGVTFAAACAMVHGFQLDDDAALAALSEIFNPRCLPPWSERELRHKVESARKSGAWKKDLLNEPRRHEPGAAGAPPKNANAAAAEPDDEPAATLGDVRAAGGAISWLWEKWIARGVLSCLAAQEGTGKTRFAADLTRRIVLGLPWPDGSPMPPDAIGRPVIWVASDNQQRELVSIADAFGIPEGKIILNTPKSCPFAGVMLDDKEEVKRLERYIMRYKPAAVWVDTMMGATERSIHKTEEARAFFAPLQEVATRTNVPIVCVTHLSTAGAPLGRRIKGAIRTMLQMTQPDKENEPTRRRLWVEKTFDEVPPTLGITMGGKGNQYDTNPPEAAGEGGPGGKGQTRGAASAKLEAAKEWLQEHLPGRVFLLRPEWEAAGHSTKTIYRAFEELGGVEDEDDRKKKTWSLPTS